MTKDRMSNALTGLEKISQPRSREIPAVMGLGNGTVEVASNPYMVWVRLYGDQNQVARAWCLDMARVDDLPIRVAHSTDRQGGQTAYEVTGFGSNDIISNREGGSPVTFDPYLPQHHETHEWSALARGRDVVNVYPRALTPGRVYPTSPASMVCNVAPVEYMYGNEIQYFAGDQTIDFTSKVPGMGLALLVYICVDGATNTLAYQYSSTFPWTGYVDPVPPTARLAILTGYVLLSSVILYNGMTAIAEKEFTYEMRPLFQAVRPNYSGGEADAVGDVVITLEGDVVVSMESQIVVSRRTGGSPAAPDTWYIEGVTKTVGPGGGYDFTTIQAAVNWFKGVTIGSNCRIKVAAGTYFEHVWIGSLTVSPGCVLEIVGDERFYAGHSWMQCEDKDYSQSQYRWPNQGAPYLKSPPAEPLSPNPMVVIYGQSGGDCGGPWATILGKYGWGASDHFYVKDSNMSQFTYEIASCGYDIITPSDYLTHGGQYNLPVDLHKKKCHIGLWPDVFVANVTIASNVKGVRIRGLSVMGQLFMVGHPDYAARKSVPGNQFTPPLVLQPYAELDIIQCVLMCGNTFEAGSKCSIAVSTILGLSYLNFGIRLQNGAELAIVGNTASFKQEMTTFMGCKYGLYLDHGAKVYGSGYYQGSGTRLEGLAPRAALFDNGHGIYAVNGSQVHMGFTCRANTVDTYADATSVFY